MHDETKANHTAADEQPSAPSISSSWMVGTGAVALIRLAHNRGRYLVDLRGSRYLATG